MSAPNFDSSDNQPTSRSAVEGYKEASRALRGTISLELLQEGEKFADADKNLLKFHGTYQQEDRDARKTRRGEGLGKYHMFMVRCRIPGGRLTADQYLGMDHLAESYANQTLRFTSRQSIQLHGIVKKNLKATIAGINHTLLSTLGACGDVNRNVMACPAPCHQNRAHNQLQEGARLLAEHLAPKTGAYHEIWLDGKPLPGDAPTEVEPLYGTHYLPRKFKIGLALPNDNCVDVYAQDLGFLAQIVSGNVIGYTVLVGGGMGMTHGKANTFPQTARPICQITQNQLVPTAEAVIKLFRDHGNRADRKRSRIKYLVHDWGVDRFRATLQGYLDHPLQIPPSFEVSGVDLHLGWNSQGNGKWWYGISIESGRVKDSGSFRLRTALRTLVQQLKPELRITPQQDVLLCNLKEDALPVVERTLLQHGVPLPGQVSPMRQWSLACPAIPTCSLAISESERALPGLLDQFDRVLQELGLSEEIISVRMTGCPNGCVRPYQSDVGIVGRSGDKYVVYVGGRTRGDRLNFQLRDLVKRDEIVPLLKPILQVFKNDRQGKESFGDFCHRLGAEKIEFLLTQGGIV